MTDYISREAALKNQRWNGRLDEYVVFVRDIEQIPAADVVEVKHGEWVCGVCSACGKAWDEDMSAHGDDWGYFDPMPPFCNNCGAKMDGGDA